MATLNLTPQAHQALSLVEMRELGHRAVDLHCRVSVVHSSGGWTIRVTSWATNPAPTYGPVIRLSKHHQHGHLADRIADALDEYERTFVFSPAELAVIQAQSQGAA